MARAQNTTEMEVMARMNPWGSRRLIFWALLSELGSLLGAPGVGEAASAWASKTFSRRSMAFLTTDLPAVNWAGMARESTMVRPSLLTR